MTVDLAKEAEIRPLHDAEKWKRGTIAAQLDVHADVVDRVLDAGSGAGAALIRPPCPSVLDPYVPFVEETIQRSSCSSGTTMPFGTIPA